MLTAELKKYYKAFAIKTVFVALLTYMLYLSAGSWVAAKYISPAIPWVILFFLVLTLFVFYYQLKESIARVSKFVNVFLLSTGLKLLIFLVICVVYAFINRKDAVGFLSGFFIVYLIFTVFENIQLLKIQHRLKEKDQQ
jgi:uncharacterized membrane protein YfcA